MKFSRRASANWKGTGADGSGSISTQTGALDKAPYSTKARFEDGKGTNPEELVGAAHAGCFTMKLSFVIAEMGFTPGNIDTKAKVTFEDGKITNIHLDLSATVDGMGEEDFQKAAKDAKENCPISVLLNTDITMDAKLV
ncbi:OsmC family protein [Echinicola sp. 20G]|uniref:OsmC family protein n=1 Tax=Echinicola sp. 20G TaxID=2781961 RepID=UPI0019110945|nr:OsmC family protein [Echinicola sp. 20G]